MAAAAGRDVHVGRQRAVARRRDPVTQADYPLTDLELARRLERAEGATNAAFIDARADLQPEAGAAWIQAAGVFAMYDGPASPLTQTFGLGVFDPVGDAELHLLEAFFEERGAPVFHEVSPLAAPALIGLLNARGYHPLELSTVLIRPTALALDAAPDDIIVRAIAPDEADGWARVAGLGWSSESADLAQFIEQIGRVLARARGVHCFLAERSGAPVAAGALSLRGDVAVLAGASTIPSARRRGAQLALLDARLRFAAAHGAELAMMAAQPGSASQRNAERKGFRTAYTRTKWQRGAYA